MPRTSENEATPPVGAPEAAPFAHAPAATSAAPAAAEPATPAPVDAPDAVPAWQGRLLGLLQRSRRYPEAARAADEQGTAVVSISMDRAGHVLALRLIRSSGSAPLDEEAQALVRRAEPLPPPPAELTGSTITLTVPIRFALR